MHKNITTGLLLSLLVSHHVNAAEAIPNLPPLLPEMNQVHNLPPSWFETHREIIIPALFVTGVITFAYCASVCHRRLEDRKPLPLLLEEVAAICHTIRSEFYAQDEALLTAHPSHLLVAQKVLAHCPGERFAYSTLHKDITNLIDQAEVKLVSLLRRDQCYREVRVAVSELQELTGWLKRLDGIITSHPNYLKEQQEKFFQQPEEDRD